MTTEDLDRLFGEMVEFQGAKLLRLARTLVPHVTGDDILNPNDFPELMASPVFNYEEGYAAGLLAAQMAVRVEMNKLMHEKEPV